MFGLKAGFRAAKGTAAMTRVDAAGVTRDISMDKALLNRGTAEDVATKALEVNVMQGLKNLDAVKFIEGKGFGAAQAEKALDAFGDIRGGVLGGASQEEIDKLIDKLADVKGLKLQEGVVAGTKGPELLAQLEFLDKIIKTLQGSQEKYTLAMDNAKDTYENATKLAEKKHKIDIKTLKLQYQYNVARADETRKIKASVSRLELRDTRKTNERRSPLAIQISSELNGRRWKI